MLLGLAGLPMRPDSAGLFSGRTGSPADAAMAIIDARGVLWAQLMPLPLPDKEGSTIPAWLAFEATVVGASEPFVEPLRASVLKGPLQGALFTSRMCL